MAIDKEIERFQHYVATVFGNMTIEYVYEDNLKTDKMRTPEELRIDYVKNSGNWLKWIKEVQDEAWNAALDRFQLHFTARVTSAMLDSEIEEIINHIKR